MKTKTAIMSLIVAFMLFGCSKDNDKDGSTTPQTTLNKETITLYRDGTYQLIITGGNDSNVKWYSDNEFVANISQDGIVNGERIGTATIYANDASCKVTVKPKYNLYTEPITEWGISKSEVIRREGTPTQQDENSLTYISASNLSAPIYIFENNKLKSVGLLIPTSKSNSLTEFLLERYVPVHVSSSSDELTAIFINSLDITKASVFVGLKLYNISYWMVIYSSTSNTKANIDMYKFINSMSVFKH